MKSGIGCNQKVICFGGGSARHEASAKPQAGAGNPVNPLAASRSQNAVSASRKRRTASEPKRKTPFYSTLGSTGIPKSLSNTTRLAPEATSPDSNSIPSWSASSDSIVTTTRSFQS